MSDHGEGAGDGQWGPPYLLYLGQAADDLAIKTARGLAFWRPEWCVGQHRHPDCRYTLGLPDMSFEQAHDAGADTMVIGTANAGGVMVPETVTDIVNGLNAGLNVVAGLHQKLRDNPDLVTSAVSEIVRWQTPVIHMRRTTTQETEVAGTRIPAGAKVVMWYVSGNRDETVIDQPDRFVIDRERPRQHLSFGFGIHRCVGLRLAELQLRIIWEEILKRFDHIDVVGEPKRVYSSFVKGLETLPVKIAA